MIPAQVLVAPGPGFPRRDDCLMEEIALAQINSFASPAPQVDFIQALLGELQALREEVARLQEDNQGLKDHIAALEARQDKEVERLCMDIAGDRQRITKLENPEVIELCGKKTNDHLKQIISILEARKASGMRYLTFSDAADILQLSRRRIAQLGEIAANDPIVHIDVIWHPKIKNQKVFKLSGVKL